MDFTKRSPLETGFSQVFADRVRPPLLKLESERVTRLAKARKWSAISLIIGVAIAGVIAGMFQGSLGSIIAAVVFVVLGIIGALVSRGIQANSWSGSVAEAMMPAICDHVGDLHYDADARGGFPIEPMRRLGILGSYDNATLTDRLEGKHRETEFEMVEAKLTSSSRDSDGDKRTNTVFKGLLFRIGVPIAVPTPILITRDFGTIGNKLGSMFSGKKGRGMPRVEMNHAAFEATFEVHAEDPDAARSFMPPGFLDNLLDIGEQEGGKKGAKAMRAGFVDESFLLALTRSGDFLAMGSLTTPVADMEEDLHEIIADIELVHRIIDRLHGV